MLVPLNWLRDYVDYDLSPADIAEKITVAGLEVEGIATVGPPMPDIVVGHILSIDKHPNADRLVVCKVDVGDGTDRCIVCGATNMKAGDKVPTALVGAEMPAGLKIEKRPLRGVPSEGMMCSATELEFGDDATGILVLPDDAPIGERFDMYAGLDETVLDVSLTPNRPDCASMIGVAREVATLTGSELRQPEINVPENGRPIDEMTSVTIEDKDLCPRYDTRVVTGVKIGPSPKWMAQRLRAAGLRPINNVVDITNYVLIEMGHPLHAFDYDTLSENRIVVRRAKAGETITTIDDVERNLDTEMLVIADSEKPVALAGVMGGAISEISDGTTNVLLESAYFLPTSIRRTSKTLGLMSEASYRFERGTDIELVPRALDRCAQLMADMAGGKVCENIIDGYPEPVARKTVTLRPARVTRLLGCDVDANEIADTLTKLGFGVIEKDDGIVVEVPTRRVDVTMETDLIEEIGRIHGLDNLPCRAATTRPAPIIANSRRHARRNILRQLLTASGFSEAINYSFISADLARRAGFADHVDDMIPISNPLSTEHGVMRTSVLPGLLNVAGANYRRDRKDCRIFEIGRVFLPDRTNELPVERERLGCVAMGTVESPAWWTNGTSVDDASQNMFVLKGFIETIAERHQIKQLTFAPVDMAVFEPDTGFEVQFDGETIGHIGEVAVGVRTDILDLPAGEQDFRVFVCELDIDDLLTEDVSPSSYTKLSPFPPAYRDLALLVDDAVPEGDIADTIRTEAGNGLSELKLFDLYRGEQVPEGKKSLAYSLTFVNDERTLTDDETEAIIERIVKQLSAQHGAALRSQ